MSTTRKALISDVMNAIHGRPNGEADYPMKLEKVESALLASGISDSGSIYGAIRGAREHGLIMTDPESWHLEIIPTKLGRSWRPDTELAPIRYGFLVDGKLTADTLTGWAKRWVDSWGSDEGTPSTEVLTWSVRDSGDLVVEIEPVGLDENRIGYCFWVAGEVTTVRFDVNA
jgi:hypothetical protein